MPSGSDSNDAPEEEIYYPFTQDFGYMSYSDDEVEMVDDDAYSNVEDEDFPITQARGIREPSRSDGDSPIVFVVDSQPL